MKRLSNQDSNNTTSTNDRLSSPRLIGEILDTNGAKLIGQTAIASAVNYLVVQNADTGNDVWLYPGGSDSDIDLVLSGKGTGSPKLSTGSQIVGTTDTQTLSGKRTNPRVVSAASYTTDTGSSLDVSTADLFIVTAQAGALKFNNPGGTPVQGQKLIIRIKDNGTARALTWDTQFRAMGVALPTTTILSKTLYMGFFFNSTDTKWDLVASAQEA